jgi:hypothetical protein
LLIAPELRDGALDSSTQACMLTRQRSKSFIFHGIAADFQELILDMCT